MAVSDLIAAAQEFTTGTVAQADSALTAAATMVAAVGYTIPNFDPVALPSAPPSSAGLVAPTLTDIALELPAEPDGALVFQDIAGLDAGDAPTFDVIAPTVNLPTAPSQIAEFTGVAPSIDTDIDFPEPPDELMNPLVPAPVLTDRVEPTKPQVTLPTFDALVPTNDAVAPTDLEGQFRSAYQDAAPSTIAMLDGYVDAMLTKYNPRFSEQMGRIEDQLARYMAGGTGLNEDVEDAIFSRSQDKNAGETARTIDAARTAAADMGFTLPNGALLAAMNRARQSGADNNARANAEIVIMQAKMEQENLQFAVTTSANLRTAMLQASLSYFQGLISINGQALEYAKNVLANVIETYNIAVRAYATKLEGYKAEAAVYDTRLKSALAGIELYRIEIQALEAMTQVDKAKVDVYRARIDALSAYADVYRARIDAVVGRASLEKLKLDLFSTQVQAYSAQVQGKSAEWQGYSSAINGETAKLRVFSTQVEAFNSQVQGYKATIEAKSEVIRSTATSNKAKADNYTARITGYAAVVSARGEKARTQLENQRQSIVSFQAQAQAAIANSQIQIEYYRATSNVAVENARLRMQAQIETGNSTRAFGASVAQLGISSAQVYGQMAGAAMSGMNTLVSELKNE